MGGIVRMRGGGDSEVARRLGAFSVMSQSGFALLWRSRLVYSGVD